MINGITNNVLAGITFKIDPSDSGYINCTGKKPNDGYVMYDIGKFVTCKATPRSGFEFSSWSGYNTEKTNQGAWFNVTRYGTLTGNFNKTPTALRVFLPKEYYDTLYSILIGVVLAPIAGWLIPFLTNRNEKERKLKYLRIYIPLIDGIYESHYKNKEECLQLLNQKRKDITALVKDGIINDSSYNILDAKISEYIDQIGNS